MSRPGRGRTPGRQGGGHGWVGRVRVDQRRRHAPADRAGPPKRGHPFRARVIAIGCTRRAIADRCGRRPCRSFGDEGPLCHQQGDRRAVGVGCQLVRDAGRGHSPASGVGPGRHATRRSHHRARPSWPAGVGRVGCGVDRHHLCRQCRRCADRCRRSRKRIGWQGVRGIERRASHGARTGCAGWWRLPASIGHLDTCRSRWRGVPARCWNGSGIAPGDSTTHRSPASSPSNSALPTGSTRRRHGRRSTGNRRSR